MTDKIKRHDNTNFLRKLERKLIFQLKYLEEYACK